MTQELDVKEAAKAVYVVETACEFVRSSLFRGQDRVDEILTEGLGMPVEVANEFICCIVMSYQEGISNICPTNLRNMTNENYVTSSYPRKLWNKLLTFLRLGRQSIAEEIGKAELNTADVLAPSCDMRGHGGEENLLTRRTANTIWHRSRSMH